MALCVWEGHSWGVLGEAQLQLGAAGSGVESACREKAFPAHSDGCLAQSVYHGAGNNNPQATVWPSPLSEGQSPLCHLSVTSLLCPRGAGSSVQGHQCFPDSFPEVGRDPAPGLGALKSLGEGLQLWR